jgi:hypothetical protein
VTNDRPVFIVGCPRSGTTLLGLMVHAHPRLAMPPETRFVIRAWRRRRQYTDLTDPAQRATLVAELSHKKSAVADLGLTPDDVRRLVDASPPTLGSVLGAVFAEFARRHGKARWGDKRPSYFYEVAVLLRLFPDAQIVHVIRDGRGNVASLKRMSWWDGTSVGAMAYWSLAEWCLRRDRDRLPADTFHVVRYEDLVSDTEAVLRRLCDFLGEPFAEEMLEPQRVRAVVPTKKRWHTRLDGPVDAAAVESWREELEPWEIGLMELVLGRALRRHGYLPSGAGRRPSPAQLLDYLKASRRMRRRARERWGNEREWDATEHPPVAALLTSRQRELAELPAD